MAPVFILSTVALAQHSLPIPISDTSPSSQERTAVDVRMSPDGAFVAYTAASSIGTTPTHSLFIRAADASSPAVQVSTIQPNTVPGFFLNIPFAWRHTGGASGTSTLVFGDRTALGGYDLREFNPATSTTALRTSFAPPGFGTNILSLQLNPCNNLISGVMSSFGSGGSSQSSVWHVNLNGGGPIFPQSASAIGQLIAVDMTPDETRGIFMENSPTSKRVFQYNVAGGVPVQVANATSSPTFGGCLDNSRIYGADSSTNDLAAWGLPPINANVPLRRNSTAAVGTASVTPSNLLGLGPKQFIAFIDLLDEVRMVPTNYGGEILVTGPPPTFTDCTLVSVDATGTKIAFIATKIGVRQVFVISTQREVRATFDHPSGSNTVTFNATAPCNANEICGLAVAFGLTATPIPFGPAGSGQIDLDSSAVSLGLSAGAPFTATPIIQNFAPSLVGTTIFYQAFRLDAATGAFMNTTRAAGVTYF